MNESDLPNNENNESSDSWSARTPKEMISTFLHESRTPLTIIKGYINILSNEEMRDNYPKALEGISHAVERLDDLWENMADYLGELMKKS